MKRTLLISLGVVLGLALVVGALFLVLRANRKPAKVYAVSEIMIQGEDMSMQSLYGTVSMDRMQTVFLSQTQTVTELCVAEGQQVQKGDVLLRFDTSLSQLSLERKQLEIQQFERTLEKDKKEYNKLAGKAVYTAYLPQPENAAHPVLLGVKTYLSDWHEPHDETDETDETGESTEPTEPAEPTETTVPTNPTYEGQSEHVPDVLDPPVYEQYRIDRYRIFSGSGTKDDPMIVALASGFELCDPILSEIMGGASSAWIAFCTCEDDLLYQPVNGTWGMQITRAGNSWKYVLFDAAGSVPSPLIDLGLEQEEPAEDPITEDERKQRMQELKEEIETTQIQLRMAELEYKRMQRELGDGAIYAQFDGIILSCNNPETAYLENVPVVKLSGGGGYIIRGAISELRLSELHVGQSVQMTSWETYQTYTGTVTEISDVPATDNYWSDGNNNVSYYPFTVTVDEQADLREYETMEMQLVSDGGASGFYLSDAFLYQENGKSYVYVRGENETLEKRALVTGRKLWGQYTEVLSGLSEEDFVAFPYAKTTEEGAKTEVGTQEELYGW